MMSIVMGFDEDVKSSLGNLNDMYKTITPEHWVMLDKVKALVIENPQVFKGYVVCCRFLIDHLTIRFAPKGKHYFDPFLSDSICFSEIIISPHMTAVEVQTGQNHLTNMGRYEKFSGRLIARYGKDTLPNMVDIFLAVLGVAPLFSEVSDGYKHLAWTFKDTSKDDFVMRGCHHIYYPKHVMTINLNVSMMAELCSLGMLAA